MIKWLSALWPHTRALGKGDPTNHREYCRDRIHDAAALKIGILDVPHAVQMLSSSFLALFLRQLKDQNVNERFRWQFVITLEHYIGDLHDEEYQTRLRIMSQQEVGSIIIVEAGQLGNAILNLPKKQ